ncbi:hypothetical protein [Streptomyces sp. NPDC054940]
MQDALGIILAMLASEITAVTGKTPSEHYAQLTDRFGAPAYARVDAPATREESLDRRRSAHGLFTLGAA